MSYRLILAALLVLPSWGYTSLSLPTTSATMHVPASAPFTTQGDYRMEFRLHDWTVPGSNATAISFGSNFISTAYLTIQLRPTGEVCALDLGDNMAQKGGTMCAPLLGHSDVILRVQRMYGFATNAGAPGSFSLEVWDTATAAPVATYCGLNDGLHAFPCPISTSTLKDWSTPAGFIGGPLGATTFSLAWFKWSSTTVPMGSPCPQESGAADVADWRFESSLANAAASGVTLTMSSPAYAASPAHDPVCVLPSYAIARAAWPVELRSYAYPLRDADLAYSWSQDSGPSTLSWIRPTSAAPRLRNVNAGTYVIRLTVSDATGSASCTQQIGSVQTDDNGVVATGNAAADTLLGPLIRYGRNPWPWFDDRHKADADLQASILPTYYRDFWVGSQGAGTVTVTIGSTRVTGSGTTFTSTFCQAPGNPGTVKQVSGGAVMLLVWYPNDSLEGYGLRSVPVASCQSDTQLTLAHAWYGDVADCGGGGCRYSYDDLSSTYDSAWTYSASGPGEGSNYYDAVAAFYALYYRTGLAQYLTAARALADRFWKYRLDSGTKCRVGGTYPDECGGTITPRVQATLGMVLRAMDGRADMWPGLENIFSYYELYLTYNDVLWGTWDIREEAYHMAIVSYCAMFDPNADARADCKAALASALDQVWTPLRAADGSWQQFYSYGGQNSRDTGTMVTLTNGSNQVVGSGTAWTAAMIANSVNGGTGRHILFSDETDKPATYAAQESTYYVPTYVDATHLTLDKPYAGTTGDHGWWLDYGAVGWGAQPFIEGLLGIAFEFTATALADTDPTHAALARSYNLGLANWQRTYSHRAATGGLQYFVQSVDCQPPIDDSMTRCTGNNNANQARTLTGTALRSIMLAYSHSGDADLKAFADTLYNEMFAKPGTCPAASTLCLPDGNYITDLNSETGWYMSGTPGSNAWHKYFGMFFGIGAGSGWPAYRVDGYGISSAPPGGISGKFSWAGSAMIQ